LIAASDGRWLEVGVDGTSAVTPHAEDPRGWPTTVQRALGRLAPPRPTAQGALP